MIAIGALLLLPAASPIESPRTRVVTSQHATIWPKHSLARFRFCSRTPIVPGSGTWTPRWKDVARFETALPRLVAIWRQRGDDRYFLTPGQFERGDWSGRWSRNYIGIVRGGRRFLYVDFAPLPNRDGFSVCDGGSSFFGIEIDRESRQIVTLEVNAVA